MKVSEFGYPLKPCPFCGHGKPDVYLYPANKHGSGSADIECCGCEARLSVDGDGDTGEEAASKWNGRA